MLDQEAFKKLWVEALRSDVYEQGRGCLRQGDKYCCLGVALDVLDHDAWVKKEYRNASGEYEYAWDKGHTHSLAIIDFEICSEIGLTEFFQMELVVMNDGKQENDFHAIADYIEANF